MTDAAFSTREKEVIDLLLQGKSNKQIAAALGVSNRTVEFHLSNVYAKLGVASRTEAVLTLSGGDLRESTGDLAPVGLRDSAVEKTGETADNGGVQIQLRRQTMKSLVRLSLAVILLTTVVVAWALVSKSRGGNLAPVALPYEVLGPATIAKDGMLFEATGHLTCTEFSFNLNGTFPLGFASQFPNEEFPPMFTDIQLQAEADGEPVQLEEYAGGGGGGGIGGFETFGQGRAFHVLSPLVEGQEVHITALVTFNDYVGIPEPVPFELYLFVENCTTSAALAFQYVDDGTILTPDGVTFPVTATLTQSELRVQVEARGPMTVVLDDLERRGNELSVYTDLRVEFTDPARTVELEESGGGGGGPGEGDTFLLTQAKEYRALSPLQAGLVIPVTIWVTFDPFAGIADPVPFSLELMVEP